MKYNTKPKKKKPQIVKLSLKYCNSNSANLILNILNYKTKKKTKYTLIIPLVDK